MCRLVRLKLLLISLDHLILKSPSSALIATKGAKLHIFTVLESYPLLVWGESSISLTRARLFLTCRLHAISSFEEFYKHWLIIGLKSQVLPIYEYISSIFSLWNGYTALIPSLIKPL